MTAPRFRRAAGRFDVVAAVIAVAMFAYLAYFSIWQWNKFYVPSWDLGIFTQLLDKYANLQSPIVDIKGPGYNLWGDHFHPILVVLAPLYRLFPSGLTLLIAQAALFAWSAYPVTRFARARIGAAAGTVVGLAYALSWGLTNAVWSQFHEIAFGVPLLAFGLVAYLEGRRRTAWILIALLVFVKEDMGLTVFAFAGIAWLLEYREVRAQRRRESHEPFKPEGHESFDEVLEGATSDATRANPTEAESRARGGVVGNLMSSWTNRWIALGAWGAVWFVLSVKVILPYWNTAAQWDYTSKLEGSGLFQAPGTKIVTVLLLIAIGGLVALRSPIAAVALPTLAWRFVGNTPFYWGWEWHYSAVLMPIMLIALVDGVERLEEAVETRGGFSIANIAAGISLACSLALMPTGPLKTTLTWEADAASSRSAIASIPEGSVVISDLRHLAYLVPGRSAFWTGTAGDTVPDYWIDSKASASEAAKRWGGSWTETHFNYIVVVKRQP